jgi:hypothetical protein
MSLKPSNDRIVNGVAVSRVRSILKLIQSQGSDIVGRRSPMLTLDDEAIPQRRFS